MKRLVTCILSSSVVLPPSIAGAESTVGETITISSEQKPVFRDGELQGCALNFEAGRFDTEYNNGKMVYISGSLNYYAFKDRMPFYALKIGIKTDPNSDFSAPENAYLVSGYSTNKTDFVDQMDADGAGFKLFRFSPGQDTLNAAVKDVSETGKLSFGYALRKGGMNAIVSIDLEMKDLDFQSPANSEMDPSTPFGWIECQAEATRSASGAMGNAAGDAIDPANAAVEAAGEAPRKVSR